MAEHPAHRIVDMLSRARFACTDEDELQRAVAKVLDTHGISYEREQILTRRDRVDFLTVDGIAIELKISCTPKELLRQVTRYAEALSVRAIVVGATDYKALKLPSSVLGKPLFVVQLRGW